DRFYVNLLASTFADYANFRFAGQPRPGEPSRLANGRPLADRVIPLMSASVAAGLLILVATLAAWVVTLRQLLGRRDSGPVPVLLVPLLAVLGPVPFAIKDPLA